MTRLDRDVWICDALSSIVMLGGGASSPPPQTTTTTSSPWGPQQPYLTEGFQGAENLYNGSGPQYYPGNTYVPYTPDQTNAISAVPGVAASNMGGIDANAGGFENNLLTGGYLSSNPALPGLTSLGYNNGGISTLGAYQGGYGLGQGTLEGLSSPGGVMGSIPGLSTLGSLSGTNLGYNPFTPTLGSIATGNNNFTGTLGGITSGNSPFTGTLGGIATGNNGFIGDLGAIASPSSLGAIDQSIASTVVPSIESQFIAGGDLTSPEAARATSSGVASALAPYALQQEQIQEGAAGTGLGAETTAAGTGAGAQTAAAGTGLNAETTAAGTGSGNLIQGGAIQGQIASELGQLGLGSLGLSENAASTLGNEGLSAGSTGAGIQEGALGTLGSTFNQGIEQMLQGTAFAPTVQSMPYTDLSNLFGVGAATQANNQNQTNANIAQWNYNQTLPYQMLNQFIGETTGNFGGTVTEPYFSNSSGSNGFAGALSGAGAGAGIGSALFGAGSGGAIGGAGLGALAGLMFL